VWTGEGMSGGMGSPLASGGPSRDLDAARAAYEAGDPDAVRAAHSSGPREHNEEHASGGGRYVKSMVFGGLDGIITTFAIVAAVAGSGMSARVVVLMGLANLIADGLSMGLGDFLSSKAELDYVLWEKKREAWEMAVNPEGEIEEMVELYEGRGMSKDDAQRVVKTMAKYKDFFVDVMMVEELGLMVPDDDESPGMNGLVTFASFVACGSLPLLAHVGVVIAGEEKTQGDVAFGIACGLTAFALFALGFVKARFTRQEPFTSGAQMLGNGGLAAAAAFLIGFALSDFAEAA